MSARPIKTVEFHQKALDTAAEEAQERREKQLDIGDSALSSWANSSTLDYHREALRVLKQANEDGEPQDVFAILKDGDRTLNAKVVNGQYGRVWLLEDEEEAKYGRKFIPTGSRSRVQKDLNLHEDEKLMPCKRYLVVTGGDFIGAAIHYRTARA